MSSHFPKHLISRLRHHIQALVHPHRHSGPQRLDPGGASPLLHGHQALHELGGESWRNQFSASPTAGHHRAGSFPSPRQRAAMAKDNRAFDARILAAEHKFGHAVSFEPVALGDGTIVGFTVTSKLDEDRQRAGVRPVLFASANGSASPEKPVVTTRTPMRWLPAAGPSGIVGCAKAVRAGRIGLPPAGGEQLVENLRLGSHGLSIEACARLAMKGAEKGGQPMAFFISAPHASVHLSTLEREQPGRYAGVVLARTA
jgi:hypothetical protein